MAHEHAKRVATVNTTSGGDMGKVSFWQLGTSVYRLNEYEPVQFDIYGLPLGARWECDASHPYWRSLQARYGLNPHTDRHHTLTVTE